jgi:hypothetical protein
MMERLSPNLARSELDVFAGPRSLSVAGAGTIGDLWKKLSYGPVTEITLAFTGIVAMGLLPVAFQGYAYWQLLFVHHYRDRPLTWVSLALSAILMACSLIIWLHFGSEHGRSIKSGLRSIRSWLGGKLRHRRSGGDVTTTSLRSSHVSRN